MSKNSRTTNKPIAGELIPAGEVARKKHPGGRPTIYKPELVSTLLQRLSSGESLRKITADPDMPSHDAVYSWLQRYPEFAEQYTRAREEQAETLADEIVALADEEPVQVVDDKGIARVDSGWVQWQKNRVEARKWVAAKLKPKKYGERVTHEGGDQPITVESKTTEELAAVLKHLELKIRGG